MKIVELPRFGIANLTVQERDVPKPGPGEVLVCLKAASLNYRDLLIVQGFYKPDLPLPLIPLSDGAGEVAALGEGVTGLKVGQRVATVFFQSWQEGPPSLPGITRSTGCEAPGALTQYGIFPATALVPVPDTMDFAAAATLPCAGVTAWRALQLAGGVGPGDTVLVLGTGGVALFALQIAKAFGASVIATSSSDEKLARAKALGADHTINYKATPEWGKAAFGMAGLGVKLVVETAGAGTLAQSIGALGWNGHISLLGSLSGFSTELNVLGLVGKNAHLHGLTVGSRADQVALTQFVAGRGLKPVIDRRVPMVEVGAALGSLAEGKHFGKVVIDI
ncbi:MAG: NAD(P)-dependent alcohol dehydrogenase [Chromatiales bacterium]|jgi:NADPH:quinone reductase-like Zn-dependent oxidoreductase|nr:NAD(P)-dependent alcohol dehydrogenase [Chromatiales bacterium]